MQNSGNQQLPLLNLILLGWLFLQHVSDFISVSCRSFLHSYYGFLKGITTLIGMIGGLTSSTLCGVILNQVRKLQAWVIAFLISLIQRKKAIYTQTIVDMTSAGDE